MINYIQVNELGVKRRQTDGRGVLKDFLGTLNRDSETCVDGLQPRLFTRIPEVNIMYLP